MVRLKWNVIHNVILVLFCDQMEVKDVVYKSLQYFLYFHPMLFNQDKVSRTICFSMQSVNKFSIVMHLFMPIVSLY